MNKIIYWDDVKNPETGEIAANVSVLINPIRDLNDAQLLEEGKKNVPTGKPFWIISQSDLPETREARDALTEGAELGEPDGVGG